MNYNQYLGQRQNRKKQWLRIRLGVLQLIHKPFLNILWVLVIVASILLVAGKQWLITNLDIPQTMFCIINSCMIFIVIFLPIILTLFLFESIGELSARRDEANLIIAFDSKELRHGCPILMNKKRIKESDVTMREFYSNIPLKTWIERMDEISDSMNVHFVEKIKYGGKSNGKRIVIYTAPGREVKTRGDLYDDEL